MTWMLIALLGAAAAGVPGQQGGVQSPSADTAQPPAPALLDTRWTLIAVGDLPPIGRPPVKVPHIVLHTGGSVSGSDGCNTIGGSYTHQDQALKFGVLMGTLMACSSSGGTDRRFREALVLTREWRIEEGELSLLDAEGTVLARLKAQSD